MYSPISVIHEFFLVLNTFTNLSFLFSNLFSQPKQCVQQVVDAETLLKVVSKIVEDIPNICLSKFKVIFIQYFQPRLICLGLLHGTE